MQHQKSKYLLYFLLYIFMGPKMIFDRRILLISSILMKWLTPCHNISFSNLKCDIHFAKRALLAALIDPTNPVFIIWHTLKKYLWICSMAFITFMIYQSSKERHVANRQASISKVILPPIESSFSFHRLSRFEILSINESTVYNSFYQTSRSPLEGQGRRIVPRLFNTAKSWPYEPWPPVQPLYGGHIHQYAFFEIYF